MKRSLLFRKLVPFRFYFPNQGKTIAKNHEKVAYL
jgi:hypothetical protein